MIAAITWTPGYVDFDPAGTDHAEKRNPNQEIERLTTPVYDENAVGFSNEQAPAMLERCHAVLAAIAGT